MDWTYPASSGDAGIFEIGRRLAEALGRAPDATSFTYDPRAMLRTTRQIERAARGGRLLVGFQKADKLLVEADRYVVLPSDAAKPRLAERLRGMALDSLRSTVAIPVVVADRV